MRIKLDPLTERPVMDVALAPGTSATRRAFDLTPVRFEFLCRVAEGALPRQLLQRMPGRHARFQGQAVAQGRAAARQSGLLSDDEPGGGRRSAHAQLHRNRTERPWLFPARHREGRRMRQRQSRASTSPWTSTSGGIGSTTSSFPIWRCWNSLACSAPTPTNRCASARQKVRYRPQHQIRLARVALQQPLCRGGAREGHIRRGEVGACGESVVRGRRDRARRRRHGVSAKRRSPASTTSPKPLNCCALRRSKPRATSAGARSSSSPSGPTPCTRTCGSTRGGASNDRRFFARTGELLYLMLCRAKRGAELGDQLVERLFDARRR